MQKWGIMISSQIPQPALAMGSPPLLTSHNKKQPLDWSCFKQGLGQLTFEDSFHPKLFYEPMNLQPLSQSQADVNHTFWQDGETWY